MTEVTRIIERIETGDPSATEQLMPLVYAELRQLAAARMRNERTAHTLTPTALVHEAYMRLTGKETPSNWSGRAHFFAAAAEAMRRILIDYSRRRNAAKRDKGSAPEESLEAALIVPHNLDELIDLDESLARFEAEDAEAATLVKLRFFAGMTLQQAADQLGISKRKADMLWAFSRAWLKRDIGEEKQLD